MSQTQPTPTEIANFLCNIPKELRDWLVEETEKVLPYCPRAHGIIPHLLKTYPDNKSRIASLLEVKKHGNFRLYASIVTLSDEEFMGMLKVLEKTINNEQTVNKR
jgi:hypothetical protein